MTRPSHPPIPVLEQDTRPFYTPKTLAQKLNVSDRMVRRMLQNGRIPSYRIEGARRISAEDVDAYLARNRDGRR